MLPCSVAASKLGFFLQPIYLWPLVVGGSTVMKVESFMGAVDGWLGEHAALHTTT